jgi:hypothetical protein
MTVEAIYLYAITRNYSATKFLILSFTALLAHWTTKIHKARPGRSSLSYRQGIEYGVGDKIILDQFIKGTVHFVANIFINVHAIPTSIPTASKSLCGDVRTTLMLSIDMLTASQGTLLGGSDTFMIGGLAFTMSRQTFFASISDRHSQQCVIGVPSSRQSKRAFCDEMSPGTTDHPFVSMPSL